jgi:putative chitinase
LFPRCIEPDEWVSALNDVLPKNEINTPERVAAFIAQCGHESGGWRVFSENLNYSASGLDAVFGKYFKRAGRNANSYARNPEKIANIVYANRMGNGDESSGDGWKYRGRGPIQITGKNNYSAFAKETGIDVVSNPDLIVEDKDVALKSAIWFWNKNNLNKYADIGDITRMTRIINGGYNGLEDRIDKYNKILESIRGIEDIDDNDLCTVLKKGMRSDGVKMLQEKLGITSDGIFGKDTEDAVKAFQYSKKLVADGIAGPKTLEAIFKD